MSNQKFINGLLVKPPNDRAPEYVKCRLSIKREELIAWLQSESGEWINADIKVSQGGKWFAAVDDWKPNQGGSQARQAPSRGGPSRSAPPATKRPQKATDSWEDDFANDPIPFATNNRNW